MARLIYFLHCFAEFCNSISKSLNIQFIFGPRYILSKKSYFKNSREVSKCMTHLAWLFDYFPSALSQERATWLFLMPDRILLPFLFCPSSRHTHIHTTLFIALTACPLLDEGKCKGTKENTISSSFQPALMQPFLTSINYQKFALCDPSLNRVCSPKSSTSWLGEFSLVGYWNILYL